MATVDEYLNNLLIKKSNNNSYTQNEERAYTYMYDLINRWKQSFNNTYYWNNIQIEMKKLRKRYQREKEEICARYVAEGKAGYGA